MSRTFWLLIWVSATFIACAPQDPLPNPQDQKRQQLSLEQDRLAALEQTVVTLRQQKAQQEQVAGTPGLSQISTTQNEIQNLTEQLEDLRSSEQDIRENASIALQNQSLAAESARSQIDSNIQALARSRQTLQMDIDLEMKNPNGTPEQRDRIGQMQQLSGLQQLQINELQAEKTNLPANLQMQAEGLNALTRAQKDELVASQADLRDQISNLRDDIARLQVGRSEARMSLMSTNQQLVRAEKAYADQLKRVQALQGSPVQ